MSAATLHLALSTFEGAEVIGWEPAEGDLGDHAVAYARAGFEVFPLRDKLPLFPSPHDKAGHGCRGECGRLGHAQYDATAQVATVARWWAQHPRANIAARIPAGVVVFDIDPRGGGPDSLAAATAELGALPATLTGLSGRGDGGCHLWFRWPGDKPTKPRAWAGIDLLHRFHRYAILAPSVHPATRRPYRWEEPVLPIAALPPAWVDRLRPKPKPRSTSVWDSFATTTGTLEALCAFVRRQAEGNRNAGLYWAARRAAEHGFTDAEAEAQLIAAGIAAGLGEHEATSTVASGLAA